MTEGSGAGDHGHLDLDTLADLTEGLLDGDQEVVVRGHLAGCARCQDDAAALRAVSSDLAALGADDAPMPAELADRLDAALTEAGDARRTSSVTVVPSLDDRRARRSPRGMQVLQVAAVLVVLLALVGVGIGKLATGGDSGSATSAGSAADSAGGSAESAPQVVSSGTDYQQGSLGQALGAVTGSGAGRQASSPGLKAETSTAAPPSPQGALSASPGTSPNDDSAGGDAAGGADGAAALASPAALSACLDTLGLVGTPLGVDLASFNGKPAAVVVLPSEGDPTHVDVYAIAPTCPAGDFLAFARVAKP